MNPDATSFAPPAPPQPSPSSNSQLHFTTALPHQTLGSSSTTSPANDATGTQFGANETGSGGRSDGGAFHRRATTPLHQASRLSPSSAIADFFAPLGRSVSGSSMQVTTSNNYSTPFNPSNSQLAPYPSSFGNESGANSGNELDLSLGWTSRNPTAIQSPPTGSPQPGQRRGKTAAASTLSSLSRQQQQHSIPTETTGAKKAQKGRQGGGDTGEGGERAGSGKKMRQGSRGTGAGHHTSATAPAAAFAPEEEDEEDELGGGGDYGQRGSTGQSFAGPSAGSIGGIGGGGWESGEGREGQGVRKQNSACDACRNRKVRCHRVPGEDKCAHCKSKGTECTTIFVQLANTGGKRPTKRPRQSTETAAEVSSTSAVQAEDGNGLIKYLILRDADYSNAVHGLSYDLAELDVHRPPPTTTAESRLFNATARFEFAADLIETYFNIVHIRYPVLDPQDFRQRFHNHSPELGGPPPEVLVAVMMAWGAKFSENPIILADRREAAHELTPIQKSKREAAAPSVAAARLAVTKPVVGGGKAESMSLSNRDAGRVIGRSRIAEDMVVKAQEVLDRNKVHRVATLDHARAALIVQALFWEQAPANEGGYDEVGTELRPRKRRGLFICNGVWTLCAISHLKAMRVHQQETVSKITDMGQRSQVAMCWWLACMMDAHMSAFYRRKPRLALEDYTTDLSAPPPAAEQQGPHPLASSHAYQIWLNSSQQQVEMMRLVYHTLFTPRSMTDGVSARKLEKLVSMAFSWRDNHLSLVGAPSPTWPSHWNFADAVTACSSDMNYHIIWILMWEAIDEYGIAELKAADASAYSLASLRHGGGPVSNSNADMELDQSKIRGLSARIYDEAVSGAVRSANLSQVLCDNGYLRLEAAIMKWAMSEAGYCLTRFQRPEVLSIIEGLRQYGQAFEECYAQANELERVASVYMSVDGTAPSSMAGIMTGNLYGPDPGSTPSSSNFAPLSDLRRFPADNNDHQGGDGSHHQSGASFDYGAPSVTGYGSNRNGANGGGGGMSYTFDKYHSIGGYPQQQPGQGQQQQMQGQQQGQAHSTAQNASPFDGGHQAMGGANMHPHHGSTFF